jgi:protein-tyrosine phosphatase
MSSLAEALKRRRDKQDGIIWATNVSRDGADDGIYLGSGQDASNLDQLQKHNIHYIINVADDVPNFHENNANNYHIEYCNLSVGDFGADIGISRVFNQAIEFVSQKCKSLNDVHDDNENSGKGNILIHCANGSNRSATVVIAIFVSVFDFTLLEAYQHIKLKHKAAHPLKDNRTQLMEWEAKYKNILESTMKEEDFN